MYNFKENLFEDVWHVPFTYFFFSFGSSCSLSHIAPWKADAMVGNLAAILKDKNEN